MTDASSLIAWLSTLDATRTTALILTVLAAHALLALVLGAATRRARARAREAARTWADEQAALWRARAQRRTQREAERARTDAERAARRGALARACLVGVIAVAATNLSAHGIQSGLAGIHLGALDTRVSAFVVFEGLLALSAALSWWHQTTAQPGYDRYRVAMWTITGVMSWLGWAWSGSPVFALWPPLAAVAWHWVVTAEARRRHGGEGWITRWRRAVRERIKRRFRIEGDADRARRLAAIERRTYRANTAPRPWRWVWVRAWQRAHDAAAVRGILDDAARAQIAVGLAARYAGPAALSPDAVATLNPWAAAISGLDTNANADADTPPPEAADARARVEEATGDLPAEPVVLHVVPAGNEPAPNTAEVPVPEAARAVGARALTQAWATDMRAKGPADEADRALVADWVAGYWEDTGKWPSGKEVVAKFGGHPATGRRWLAAIRDAA